MTRYKHGVLLCIFTKQYSGRATPTTTATTGALQVAVAHPTRPDTPRGIGLQDLGYSTANLHGECTVGAAECRANRTGVVVHDAHAQWRAGFM